MKYRLEIVSGEDEVSMKYRLEIVSGEDEV